MYFDIYPKKGREKFLRLTDFFFFLFKNVLFGVICRPNLKSLWLFILPAANGSSSGKVGKPPCGTTKRSIADSEESEAYKSLFTTHSSAKRSKEESAHWVTHTSYCF